MLLTLDDVTRRSHHQNAYRTFAKLLELGVLPIVNENDTVATTEIRFGDNDRLAALVAHLVHADLLLLLSDVDGLYDGPARATPAPGLLADVRGRGGPRRGADRAAPGAQVSGTGGMQTKVEAARIATGAGIPAVLASAGPGGAGAGRRAGGHAVPPHRPAPPHPAAVAGPRHRARRAGWSSTPAPSRAVAERRASLLPAGITGVDGDLRRRRPGRPRGPPRARHSAAGLVNYDAAELPAPDRPSTRDLAKELGSSYEREVVHRDDLVLLAVTTDRALRRCGTHGLHRTSAVLQTAGGGRARLGPDRTDEGRSDRRRRSACGTSPSRWRAHPMEPLIVRGACNG